MEDTISILQRNLEASNGDPRHFRLPLRAQFQGEDGLDEGGVRREFFQVLTRKLFDPSYGMYWNCFSK